MKAMERLFRRCALFRTGFDVNGPTPCGYLGRFVTDCFTLALLSDGWQKADRMTIVL